MITSRAAGCTQPVATRHNVHLVSHTAKHACPFDRRLAVVFAMDEGDALTRQDRCAHLGVEPEGEEDAASSRSTVAHPRSVRMTANPQYAAQQKHRRNAGVAPYSLLSSRE